METIFKSLWPVTLKGILTTILILAFVWLVIWGDILGPNRSLATIVAFVIGWLAFSILAILRAISFILWIAKKK